MNKTEMKTAEEILNNKITKYNATVGNISKLQLNNREHNLFIEAMEEYASQPSEQEVKQEPDGWISAKERLPENKQREASQVIVLSHPEGKSPLSICGVYYMGTFYLQEDWKQKQLLAPELKYATHWMPLPEPVVSPQPIQQEVKGEIKEADLNLIYSLAVAAPNKDKFFAAFNKRFSSLLSKEQPSEELLFELQDKYAEANGKAIRLEKELSELKSKKQPVQQTKDSDK
jgi:hypothetical protein